LWPVREPVFVGGILRHGRVGVAARRDAFGCEQRVELRGQRRGRSIE